MPPAPSNWVLLFGFIVVGVPFATGVITTVEAIQQSAHTEEAEGTVVGFELRDSPSRGGGVMSKPVIEYRVAGQAYRCSGEVATNLPVYAVGDMVPVRYRTAEPGTAFIDTFFDRWLCPLLFTGGGLLFLFPLSAAVLQKIKGTRATTRRNSPTRRHTSHRN